jgi:hypothetical protein
VGVQAVGGPSKGGAVASRLSLEETPAPRESSAGLVSFFASTPTRNPERSTFFRRRFLFAAVALPAAAAPLDAFRIKGGEKHEIVAPAYVPNIAEVRCGNWPHAGHSLTPVVLCRSGV